jgi:hypothetical protein
MKLLATIPVLLLWCAPALAADCFPASIQKELARRLELDQSARSALADDPVPKEANERALRVDADNTAYMRELLAKCGWPRQSRVGKDAARTAWLLTQHADMDPQYQALAAQQMKYAVLAKEADPKRLALLVDRNRRLTDQPQVYGMQFYVGPDKVVRFYDIITPRKLDARRVEIGLGSFYCWALQLSRDNGGAAIEWPAGVLFVPTECGDGS